MKPVFTLFWGVLLLTVSSCAYYCTPLSTSDKIGSQSAVLYGRFTLTAGNVDGFRIGLWVEDISSGKDYYLAFMETNATYGVEVKPGNYRIMGFVGSNREHEAKARREFGTATNQAALSRPFEVKPGFSTYIGDFTGAATYDGVLIGWKLNTFTNNFVLTTVEFHRQCRWSRTMPVNTAFDKY